MDNGGKAIANRIDLYTQWVNPDEKIKAADASKLQFSAKTHRGSYLREIGKVSFTKLRDIKRFYEAVFGEEARDIFGNVADGQIYVLNAIRNCILHAAGKVDGSFKRAVQKFKEYDSLEIGDPFLLNGELVKNLRNASAEVGLALLSHVDAMLLRGD